MSNVINMLGGSGGLKPVIIVNAPTGSTVTLDGITGTEVSGTWTFNTSLGTHTVVATSQDQTQTKTETVLVDEVARYEITISYSRVPAEYQEVEWIHGSGNQYLNMGILGNSSLGTRIQTTAIFDSIDRDVHMICGSRSGANSRFCFGSDNGSPVQFDFALNDDNLLFPAVANVEYVIDADFGNQTCTVNGTTYSISVNPLDTNLDMFLFTRNYNGSAGQIFKGKIKETKAYQNNTLCVHLIPCYRKSDGVGGMYDIINQIFRTNQGSGSFDY